MNAVRSEMRRGRETQSMTFDVLAKRCATLGYEISRVVLSKIEGGYRPDVTLPELLVIARALNVGPAQLVTPLGTADQVELLPDVALSPLDAWTRFAGQALPTGMAGDLPSDAAREDAEVFLELARPAGFWLRHERLEREWVAVATEAQTLGLDRADEVELIARRQRPIATELLSLRRQCERLGVTVPPVSDEALARSLDALGSLSDFDLGGEMYRSRRGALP